MNDVTAPPVSPAAAPAADGPTRALFTGRTPAFRRLMIRGALLQLVTLGIYRFWLTTDMRRFYWANTDIGGESAEYTGTAVELLIGFLIAIAILVPIFVLIVLAGLSLGPAGQFAGLIGYVVLGVLGQYAYFRARRYRLTRTVFRGVRLHQTGSAWGYALRSILWGILVLLTLGLAYPFAQESLERYKLSCTWYGDLQGSFVGRGSSLFARGFLIWLLVLGPLVAGFAYAAATVDWSLVAAAVRPGADKAARVALFGDASFKATMSAIISGFSWSMLALVLLYPAYEAIALRWWLGGVRLGTITASSNLRKRQVYGAYLRYFGWSMLVLIAAVLAVVAVSLIGWAAGDAIVGSAAGKNAAAVVGVAGAFVFYLVLAFCLWIVYQVTVKLRLWRMMVDSLAIEGIEALAHARADMTRASSAVGEGLVDALGAGGM